jgi:hypothetical protein
VLSITIRRGEVVSIADLHSLTSKKRVEGGQAGVEKSYL